MEPRPLLTCTRCGYRWMPIRKDKDGNWIVPERCANKKCNSPYWNRPRLKK